MEKSDFSSIIKCIFNLDNMSKKLDKRDKLGVEILHDFLKLADKIEKSEAKLDADTIALIHDIPIQIKNLTLKY